jgi:hypothetical protein
MWVIFNPPHRSVSKLAEFVAPTERKHMAGGVAAKKVRVPCGDILDIRFKTADDCSVIDTIREEHNHSGGEKHQRVALP